MSFGDGHSNKDDTQLCIAVPTDYTRMGDILLKSILDSIGSLSDSGSRFLAIPFNELSMCLT